ncbi:MAG TPA: S46 family peptidase [Polyangiales bacterium]|nr:S46 family peptidase [Polyangiales bacterium]
MHKPIALLFVAALVFAFGTCFTLGSRVRADEGMWLPNQFPSAQVGKKYGFTPDQAWLDHVRLSSARLAQGCSGSFVSRDGLVMTNHHCAHECIEQLSASKRDLVAQGFYAAKPEQELRCPALEVNQLISIEDVSQRMAAALAGKVGQVYSETKKAEQAKLEKACAESDQLRCEVVELYHGARQHLYKYRRYQDVRVVFVPELAIAFFGGDPDNFNFPRYDLDVAFLRIYANDKPAQVDHFFPFSAAGAKADELTFTSGHPGSTSRELAVSELLFERRVRLPRRLWLLSELRGQLTEFGRRGPEQKRISEGLLFGVENAIKAFRGRLDALLDGELLQQKRSAEEALKKRLSQDKRAGFAGAFASIDKAMVTTAELYDYFDLLERGRAFPGDLFDVARTLVRAADELGKPNEARLPEFTDAALPGLKQGLFSPAPIHPELEILQLTFGLTKLREILSPDDPVVRKLLGKKSPAKLAAELIRGSTLADVNVRKKLFEGGAKAIEASRDPLLAFARLIDGDARAVRKRVENEIDSVLDRAHEAIATARFEAYGSSVYPDATFTLRISYGTVKGWQERGKQVPPFTDIRGAFERHTGEDPFALPKSWLAKREQLKLDTPFNFVTTNDIVGGNSGSPVIDKNAEIVGLIFDGNIHSLGGDYGFDERVNRAVAVHSSAILEALRVVYGAQRIADELRKP